MRNKRLQFLVLILILFSLGLIAIFKVPAITKKIASIFFYQADVPTSSLFENTVGQSGELRVSIPGTARTYLYEKIYQIQFKIKSSASTPPNGRNIRVEVLDQSGTPKPLSGESYTWVDYPAVSATEVNGWHQARTTYAFNGKWSSDQTPRTSAGLDLVIKDNPGTTISINEFLVTEVDLNAEATIWSMDESQFFNQLNLDYPGLEAVKTAVLASNWPVAKSEYLNYLKARQNPAKIAYTQAQKNDLLNTVKNIPVGRSCIYYSQLNGLSGSSNTTTLDTLDNSVVLMCLANL